MGEVSVADRLLRRLRKPEISEIQDATRKKYNVTKKALLSPYRNKYVVHSRHVGMYLAHLAGYSYPTIAREYKRKNHTTALHATKKIERILTKKNELASRLELELEELKAELRM